MRRTCLANTLLFRTELTWILSVIWMFTQDVSHCHTSDNYSVIQLVLFGALSKAQLLGPHVGPSVRTRSTLVFLTFALGAMASHAFEHQAASLGAHIFEY